MQSCSNSQNNKEESAHKFHLTILDPGHFHAVLLQRSNYNNIDTVVRVYAPEGPELENYLDYIKDFNNRAEDPTHWKEVVYTGPGYLQRMLQDKQADNSIVVLAGNNERKIKYINKAVGAGMNVFVDKPMVITPQGFEQLENAFETAEEKNVVLFDIMTERYTITNILQKMLLHMPGVFGELKEGTSKDPAIIFKDSHYFYKNVAGKPIVRPAWYFDTDQQGEGIVDITTHLIDIINWACFPKTVFDYKKDVQMLSASHWPTKLSLEQFAKVTRDDSFPSFLKKDVKDGQLYVYANGDMHYTLKGINVEVGVKWKFAAPDKGLGTFFYEYKGTKANLISLKDNKQNPKPTLYIKPVNAADKDWQTALQDGLDKIHKTYPGVSIEDQGDSLKVVIPGKYDVSAEQSFADVIERYMQYLKDGKLPEWEKSFMLTKYYITTQALHKARAEGK